MFKNVTWPKWAMKIVSTLVIGSSIQCNRYNNNQSIGRSPSSSDGIPTTVSFSDNGPATVFSNKLVVMLHGTDSNGSFWETSGFLESIRKKFTGFHFITPNGVEKSDIKPDIWNWFNVEDLFHWMDSREYEKIMTSSPLMKEIYNRTHKELVQQMPAGVVDHQLVQKINNNLSLNAREYGKFMRIISRYLNDQILSDSLIKISLKLIQEDPLSADKVMIDLKESMDLCKSVKASLKEQLSPSKINEQLEQFSRKGIINDKQINHLMECIQQEQAKLNLANKDTVIIGFSQGAIIGLYLTLMQKKEPFLCTIGLSGLLMPPMEDVVNTQTPICLIHGGKDNVVPVECLDAAVQYCKKHSMPRSGYKIQEYDHMDIVSKDRDTGSITAVDLIAQFAQKYIKM